MTTATSTALSLRRVPVAIGLGLILAAGLVTTLPGQARAEAGVSPSGPVSIVNDNYSSRDYDPVTIPAFGVEMPSRDAFQLMHHQGCELVQCAGVTIAPGPE